MIVHEVAQRIEALGYACKTREDRIVVPLGQWQAEVVPDPGGGCLFSVLVGSPASEISREAITTLLGAMNSHVRVVYGVLEHAGKAGFAGRVAPGYLDEDALAVLEALAVACHYFAKSVSVLENEPAARRYLALTQTSPQLEGELQTC